MSSLSGLQKAAILLMSLGRADAAAVVRHLRPAEVEALTVAIANTSEVDSAVQHDVLTEFYHASRAGALLIEGGADVARRLLEEAFGAKVAAEIMHKLTAFWQRRPFDALRRIDASLIHLLLAPEHPQTIALVLAYLDPEQAARVLEALPETARADVARRIAMMEPASPDVLREVEALVQHKLSVMSVDDIVAAGGVNTVVPVLNHLDPSSERAVLDRIEERDPALAEEIRSRLFVFDDIVSLDDLAIQKVLRRVDSKTLATALKGTPPEVSDKIFRNLSQKAGALLREDQAILGPVRVRDVDQAQREVVAIIRQLEAAGDLVISRGRTDDFIA